GVPGDGSVPPRHRLPGVLQGGPGPQGGHGALRGGGGGGLGGAEQGEEVAGGLFPFGGVGAAGVVLGEAVEAAVGGAEGLAGDVFGGVLVGGLPGGVAERGCGEAGGGSGVHGGLSGSGAGWFPRPRGGLVVGRGGRGGWAALGASRLMYWTVCCSAQCRVVWRGAVAVGRAGLRASMVAFQGVGRGGAPAPGGFC